MTYQTIKEEIQSGICTITLNRPEKHNALDETMMAELTKALQQIDKNDDIRIVVITQAGRHFCAGADLNWMAQMGKLSYDENKAGANRLISLFKALSELSKPTIALVQGKTMGGGLGILACCDIVYTTPEAQFCFSEVKLGLVAATIAPFVVRRMGEGSARHYLLTTELFSAEKAKEAGLVHEIVAEKELLSAGMALAKSMTKLAPNALKAAKKLMNDLSPISSATLEKTATLLAEVRSSAECKEGVQAFLEKRQPNWILHD